MAANINRLSRLMKISWDIQKQRHKTRSSSLIAAWAIMSNEDITIQYLTQKLNRHKPIPQRTVGQFALFNH